MQISSLRCQSNALTRTQAVCVALDLALLYLVFPSIKIPARSIEQSQTGFLDTQITAMVFSSIYFVC
jgi:hypothetical protein